jgi:hypothetical protein
MRTAPFIFGSLLLLSGCATYEYGIYQPPPLARHISSKAQTTLFYDPLNYTFQAVDNRLVIWINNPTGDPITLVGERSVIVDPDGQSHPLRSQTIAPGSFIKLILPPLRPYAFGYGPGYYVGSSGFIVRHGSRRGGVYVNDGYYYGNDPCYMTIYDPGDPTFFQWQDQTDVRMTLAFERLGKTLEHTFAFHRVKVG